MVDHRSDCAMHNGPALPPGPCNCGADPGATVPFAIARNDAGEIQVIQGDWMVAACGTDDQAMTRAQQIVVALVFKMRSEETDRLDGPFPHADDLAIDEFAAAMKAKMARRRADGAGGWDDPARCDVLHLASLLVNHVIKGDPVDVANFCMMLHHREGGREALKHRGAIYDLPY